MARRASKRAMEFRDLAIGETFSFPGRDEVWLKSGSHEYVDIVTRQNPRRIGLYAVVVKARYQ